MTVKRQYNFTKLKQISDLAIDLCKMSYQKKFTMAFYYKLVNHADFELHEEVLEKRIWMKFLANDDWQSLKNEIEFYEGFSL